MLFQIKKEAPAPAPQETAQTFEGSPLVRTPATPGPPRTVLPATKAEAKATEAQRSKTKSAIQKKPRASSCQASVQAAAHGCGGEGEASGA